MSGEAAAMAATTTSSANKASARKVLEEVFPAEDEAALAGLVSPQFVNHEAPEGTPPGLGAITYFMHLLHRSFSEQRWTIHDIVEEGDLVAVRCTHSGRHTGEPFFGMPARGREFSYHQMHLLRMRDGVALEHWEVRDDATMTRQLTG